MKFWPIFFLPIYAPMVMAGSICFGTTSNGKLEQGCKLPINGENYSSYSISLSMIGRTYVHCDVRQVIVDSYGLLEKMSPSKKYVYGETGTKNGGPFSPHKTHQNGLSVDFMVPVKDKKGSSLKLPTSLFNKYGYDMEFTLDGKYKDEELYIDFEAMALHLAAVKSTSEEAGVGIWRVIFDPKMQPKLRETAAWSKIKTLKFSANRSWVRHDDHYHVDFEIPCESMRNAGE